MLTTPTTTTIQYGSPADDVFKHDMTSNQSPSDGFVALPPPPPPPPAPPAFNSSNINNSNPSKVLLPHQEVSLVINRANINEIAARSVPAMLMAGNNIWTRRVLPNLRIMQTVFDQHYGESKSTMTGHYRRASLTASFLGGGGGGGLGGTNDDGPLSFVLLDATSKMLYDVPMRHLLQLVKKDHDDDASIDHVIRAIDETHMNSEWLDAVTALNKQFDKRPEDKARVLAHKGSTHGLVLIEQFFVKLVRVPAYEFKLIFLKFREEAPTQLERMNKHIDDLLESVQVILTNEQLPGILHVLCLLYNSISGKSIPGLHFDSLLSVLSTRTPKQNTTLAHVLCHLLEEQYPTLLNVFDDQILVKLKDLSAIKHVPIYTDVRLLHTRYKHLNITLRDLQQQLILLPDHIKNTLADLQIVFTKLFDDENKIKKCEKDLSAYFCVWDLSLEVCLSTLGQFMDKLRLAHMQNVEQRRRNDLLLKQQQQRTCEQRTMSTPTTARLLRNCQSQYGSDTNIFRDHLNVPLTPTTARQRHKVNKIVRERISASSRDISYTTDEQQEQMETINLPGGGASSSSLSATASITRTQNLLPNAIPRKRGHSPAAKTVLTKRSFNALPVCTPSALNQQFEQNPEQQTDDVFISTTANDEQDDDHETKMDCSTATSSEDSNDFGSHSDDDHLLPSHASSTISTARVISVCEIQPSFYLTAPIRRLYGSGNETPSPHDQSTPHSSMLSIDYETHSSTPSLSEYHHLEYSDAEDENNKENKHHLSTLTPITTMAPSSEIPNTTELSPKSDAVEDESPPSSSSSSPANTSSGDLLTVPIIPSLTLSDSETLDEGFETQSNVSETIESTPRPCPIETTSFNETISLPSDELLADELTRRLNFNSTRRLSHDSSTSSVHHKRTSMSHGRPLSSLKTSTSAYSYPTFSSCKQQNQLSHSFTKRTPSAESLRSTSTSNNAANAIRSSRHIQRCAVSRRISTEKDVDDTTKPSTTTSTSLVSPPTTTEPDEISSSSTLTTTTTTVTAPITTTTTNRRLVPMKPKHKIRSVHALATSGSRSNSPMASKALSRLGHASSCHNVSTGANIGSPKSSALTKTRSPPTFFLNSSQIVRSSFSRPSEKPLRALHLSTTMNHESLANTRASPRSRRLLSSSSDVESTSTSSPKHPRKPPSSWHHTKSVTNKAMLTTVLPASNNLAIHRKASTSALDLRKTAPTSVFQRVNASKRS